MKLAAAITAVSVIMLMIGTMPVSYGYVEQKTYKLFTDGYISARAKITCWQYGNDEGKISVSVDIVKAFHAKGRNIFSAYIIDLDKNGPEHYLQIGKSALPRERYDYAGFSQQFIAKDFSDGKEWCPISSTGRIVVVVGTSPPSDSDTLSRGAVDIIAATTTGTAQKGSL
jgi:hypothetical protein